MSKLVPPILNEVCLHPFLEATRQAILEKLDYLTDLFSPVQELYLFIQLMGQRLFENMNTFRYHREAIALGMHCVMYNIRKVFHNIFCFIDPEGSDWQAHSGSALERN